MTAVFYIIKPSLLVNHPFGRGSWLSTTCVIIICLYAGFTPQCSASVFTLSLGFSVYLHQWSTVAQCTHKLAHDDTNGVFSQGDTDLLASWENGLDGNQIKPR